MFMYGDVKDLLNRTILDHDKGIEDPIRFDRLVSISVRKIFIHQFHLINL